jgi:FtsP/CotA-like multicopper oxidase with cupredoxin domain
VKVRPAFKRTALCAAVVAALASGGVRAGAGWGDSTDISGAPTKVPTFYANSPAGLRPDPINPVIDPATLAPVPTIDTGAPLRKFVDTLAPLGCATANDLGQCIPVAVPDTTTYPDADYYEIGVVQYQEKMHSDLPKATTLRGYVQLIPGTTTPMTSPHYLGPVIVATQGRPVRIKYTNLLPTGPAGDLFVPVDHTLMGAGMGPDGATAYTENRAEIHLHGGDNPWISDGTPHQWTVPVGELTSYMNGAAFKNVPDMPDPGQGSGTLYWPNNQSGRFMFYHDHTAGITRINVYVGEAAGYLITDPVERGLMSSGVLPADEIPLVIQDKTFVPQDVALQDARWDLTHWGQPGDLWWPHVYEPNQDPNSFDGTNPVGRWDWGPWFWPVFPAANPLPTGVYGDVSTTPEAFHDTPVINGTAYPTLTVDPKAYRLRVLNAANDRMWNLGLYVAASTVDRIDVVAGGAGYVSPQVTITPDPADTAATGATATATVDANGAITAVTVTNPGTGYTLPPTVTLSDLAGSGAGAVATAVVGTEVAMVPAVPTTGWPARWPTDGRDGGVPDPASIGPDIIQIGSEGGLLPAAAVIPSTPVNYEYNRRSVTVLNISTHGLLLGPAERADVVIDFSQFAGKTLIVYNDAPAPVPAFDPRIDYYTNDGDQTGTGGAPSTVRGYGPNTRTLMQIKVTGTPGANGAPFDLATLQAALPGAYAASQPKPIVPGTVYNAPFGTSFTDTWARIYTGSLTAPTLNFTAPEALNYTTIAASTTLTGPLSYTLPNTTTPLLLAAGATASVPAGTWVGVDANTAVQMPVQNKAIQELFEPMYGRMNATLGTELPFTSALTQTTIPLGYVDPATEVVKDGETQIWKITHNGVDTHAVHFHLVNVQLLNRIGWDGTIKPAEPNEVGWKETVRMNPLEDIVVAVRAKNPQVPFGQPRSVRLADPSQPEGATLGFTQVDPFTGFPKTVTNTLTDYDGEYVWHCHILGHEENDMMRPVVFHYPTTVPAAPSPATVDANGVLAWTDTTPNINLPLLGNPAMNNPASEIGFKILRSADGVNFTQVATALANTTTWTDPAPGADNWYEVVAWNASGDSAPSNLAHFSIAPPPAVTGLTGISNSPTTIDLSWAAAATQITGYQIQRCLGTACTGFTATAGATGFADSGLTQATTYSYSVSALNGAVAGPAATVDVTTQYAAAPAITGLTATGTTATGTTLSWAAPTGAVTGFTVQRCLGTSCTSFTLGAAATGFVDSGLAQGTLYTYSVNAVNGPNIGPVATVDVTTGWSAAPAISGLAITATAYNAATLNWAAPTSAVTGFTIQRCLGASCTTFTAPANATSFADSGLVEGSVYTYSVNAVNGPNVGPVSTVSFTTGYAAAPAITGLSAVATSSNAVTVSWAAPTSPVTGFTVQRCLGTACTSFTAPATATSFADTGLASGTTYVYNVNAVNGPNVGTPSSVSVTTQLNIVAPTNLGAAVLTNPTRIRLTWTDNATNETGFMIQRSVNGGAFVTIATRGALTGTGTVSYTDTAVTAGNSYAYRVATMIGAAQSAFSNTVNVTIQAIPAAPSGLAVAAVFGTNTDTATVTWIDNSTTETGFRIQRATNATFSSSLVSSTVGANVTSFVSTGLQHGRVYYFRVRAYNATGNSAWSAVVSVTAP